MQSEEIMKTTTFNCPYVQRGTTCTTEKLFNPNTVCYCNILKGASVLSVLNGKYIETPVITKENNHVPMPSKT
jgi:hypothetical protein